METTKEISALFNLIDDPDEEVYTAVTNRIVGFGKPIIPHLENLWETTEDNYLQERIELLIHQLHLSELTNEFKHWMDSPDPDLLTGALLTSKFYYPDLFIDHVLRDINKLKRNTWLELNNQLTPFEEINVISGMLYNFFGLKGTDIGYNEPTHFLLNKVLETKKGNQLSNGILYLVISEMLDIPVKAIRIPEQFILGYIKPALLNQPVQSEAANINFFIEPITGQVYTIKDVNDYLARVASKGEEQFFTPMTNREVISYLLSEFAQCFTSEKDMHKQDELKQLSSLLLI